MLACQVKLNIFSASHDFCWLAVFSSARGLLVAYIANNMNLDQTAKGYINGQ